MRALKMLDVKMTDVKLTDQFAGHEIAGHEIAGHKRAGYESGSEAANVWGSTLPTIAVSSLLLKSTTTRAKNALVARWAHFRGPLIAIILRAAIIFGPSFSWPAISCLVISCLAILCPANWSVIFTSNIFSQPIYTRCESKRSVWQVNVQQRPPVPGP